MKEYKSPDKIKPTASITNIVTGGALDEACAWALEQRKNYSANQCTWHLRHQARIGLRYAQNQSQALIGRYRA